MTQPIPIPYTFFFLTLEPLTALAGFYAAAFHPAQYLHLTTPWLSSPPLLPTATKIVLTQLSNLYLLFALNEALVLRATRDRRVWRTLLFGLLVADLGHLASVAPLGHRVYWAVWEWNSMAVGNVGIVYAGAAMRIAFLMGVGLG